jgi:DNA-binding NarL/FixJ family response regulator
MASEILVLVIEDNRLMREGLEALLSSQPGVEVVAAVESEDAAVLEAQRSKPNVALVDATVADRCSHGLVQSVRRAAPEARVVVMNLPPARQDAIQFIQAGASGFLMKDATRDDLFVTIRSVAAGATVVPPALASALLSYIAAQAAHGTPGVAESIRMTRREREIAALIAQGLSNKEIAQRLNVAPYTVKSHVHSILERLALHSRLQIAALVHGTGAARAER